MYVRSIRPGNLEAFADSDYLPSFQTPRLIADGEDHHEILGTALVQEACYPVIVHGIVPAHIFPQHDKLTASIKDGRGMQAAGLGEGFLRRAQSRWQSRQDLGRNGEVRFHWREMLMDCFDGGLAAEAATR